MSSAPRDPQDATDAAPGNATDDVPPLNADKNLPEHHPPGTNSSTEECAKRGSSPYGSGVRRAMRNKKAPAKDSTTPTATIPDWFYERNTMVHSGEQSTHVQPPQKQVRIANDACEQGKVNGEGYARGAGADEGSTPESSERPESDHRYALTDAVWEELCASLRAGFRLPPSKYSNEPSALKSHLVLQYPGNDGILFLDAVVKKLAHEMEADMITLNAQDIAQLCSEQDLADSGMTSPIRSLGYDVYRPSAWQESDDGAGEGEGDDTDMMDLSRGMRPEASTPKFITIESSRDPGDSPLPTWLGLKSLMSTVSGPMGGSDKRGSDNTSDHRWNRLVNELISSTVRRSQRSAMKSAAEEEPPAELQSPEEAKNKVAQSRNIIIQIQDYRDIQNTREGAKFISLLLQVIQSRRQEGLPVVLVGTVARDITLQDVTADDGFTKTLVVTPAPETRVTETFAEDQKRRTMDVNLRHLQEMLHTRLHKESWAIEKSILENRDWPLSAQTIKEAGLDERFWTYNQIHWMGTLALGCVGMNEPFGFKHIQRGIELLQKTDSIKTNWLQGKSPKSQATETGASDRERLLKSLRKTCNTHEKKLLNGVVDAKSIHTTFEDVRVPSEAIDALKTLTSLSLIRPEAFTYGVLSRDKIPGLLLYGPPGTGKTLLAKAVAHESGATVLEVSGSDVYDMYVGEGEKNVKAIFSLAEKLSPCVVFIDEADAIFGSRTGGSGRTSHRELINQFLREWDGMNNLSAFIMVATNRPFDLDDAVLRRLPRRLLVDLPTEQDRLAILQIHLKEETLDPSVDLPELSRRTPLYSGSDLKNLCVAAALTCVRQENEMAAQYQGEEPYRYPSKRTLTWEHFQRGMEEISASISEDMASLSAIRKFDEQYGDRKGRRKGLGWGFTPSNAGPNVDAARVRT